MVSDRIAEIREEVANFTHSMSLENANADGAWLLSEYDRLTARNKLLEVVAEAANKLNWRSAERDCMEFKTTCWRKEELEQALAALKGE